MGHSVTPKMVEALGRRHLMLFAGRASNELAREVASHLGLECGSVDLRNFANGETYARFGESVRGTDAFVIQTHSAPVNERIMEQLIMIDALKRGSAKRISAVVPYYGYSRQDKKGRSREPITAKLVADLLQGAGADRIITIDLHSGQIQGFFDGPVDHLTALPVLADYIGENYPGELVVVAPDAGRVKAAEKLAGILGQSLAFLHKRRSRDVANQVEVREVVGEVQGRHCVLIDDIVDTAGTIVKGRRSSGSTRSWCCRSPRSWRTRSALCSRTRASRRSSTTRTRSRARRLAASHPQLAARMGTLPRAGGNFSRIHSFWAPPGAAASPPARQARGKGGASAGQGRGPRRGLPVPAVVTRIRYADRTDDRPERGISDGGIAARQEDRVSCYRWSRAGRVHRAAQGRGAGGRRGVPHLHQARQDPGLEAFRQR